MRRKTLMLRALLRATEGSIAVRLANRSSLTPIWRLIESYRSSLGDYSRPISDSLIRVELACSQSSYDLMA